VSLPGVANGPLPTTCDAVVIGAGINGLAVAYELAKRGMRDVCVVDAAHPGAGASGRNGEMLRSAFASPEWIGLFDYSLGLWRRLAEELDGPTLYTSAGYLVLASTSEQVQLITASAARHREHGLRTRLLSAPEVLDLVPALNPAVVAGGLLQRDAGFAHHDASVWSYAKAAARHGVAIHGSTTVTGIDVTAGRVTGIRTGRGPISTSLVVNAAGGRARDVAALAGVAIPTITQRLEAFVTESCRPFLRPALAYLDGVAYCHQTTRGEFVGGTEVAGAPMTDGAGTTLAGLRDAARKFVHALPVLADARIIRQWAGIIDASPDFAPILGPVDEVAGLWLDCGWSYGFMGAPGAGRLLAEAITSGRTPELLAPFSPGRFAAGRLIAEGSLVVTREEEA
jgi:sarcosine oxidase subunit beta